MPNPNMGGGMMPPPPQNQWQQQPSNGGGMMPNPYPQLNQQQPNNGGGMMPSPYQQLNQQSQNQMGMSGPSQGNTNPLQATGIPKQNNSNNNMDSREQALFNNFEALMKEDQNNSNINPHMDGSYAPGQKQLAYFDSLVRGENDNNQSSRNTLNIGGSGKDKDSSLSASKRESVINTGFNHQAMFRNSNMNPNVRSSDQTDSIMESTLQPNVRHTEYVKPISMDNSPQ